jgi:hypothetical protein
MSMRAASASKPTATGDSAGGSARAGRAGISMTNDGLVAIAPGNTATAPNADARIR